MIARQEGCVVYCCAEERESAGIDWQKVCSSAFCCICCILMIARKKGIYVLCCVEERECVGPDCALLIFLLHFGIFIIARQGGYVM